MCARSVTESPAQIKKLSRQDYKEDKELNQSTV
jgi:hypothetical protein